VEVVEGEGEGEGEEVAITVAEEAMMPRRRIVGLRRSRRQCQCRDKRGGDPDSGVVWRGVRLRGMRLGGEDRGRGIEAGDGEVDRWTEGGTEGCGLGTITGRGARDGEQAAGRGVGAVVAGTRSRAVRMRARGLGARVGGEKCLGRE